MEMSLFVPEFKNVVLTFKTFFQTIRDIILISIILNL